MASLGSRLQPFLCNILSIAEMVVDGRGEGWGTPFERCKKFLLFMYIVYVDISYD